MYRYTSISSIFLLIPPCVVFFVLPPYTKLAKQFSLLSVQEFCNYLARTLFRAAIALCRRCTYVQHDVCRMLCLAEPTMTRTQLSRTRSPPPLSHPPTLVKLQANVSRWCSATATSKWRMTHRREPRRMCCRRAGKGHWDPSRLVRNLGNFFNL